MHINVPEWTWTSESDSDRVMVCTGRMFTADSLSEVIRALSGCYSGVHHGRI